MLGDDIGGTQADADKKQVNRQPEIVADGDRREVGRVVMPRHNGIDHAGADLGQLGDDHRPGEGEQGAALGQDCQWLD